MPDVKTEGAHVHEACTRCKVVEPEPDSDFCAECTTQLEEEAAAAIVLPEEMT